MHVKFTIEDISMAFVEFVMLMELKAKLRLPVPLSILQRVNSKIV